MGFSDLFEEHSRMSLNVIKSILHVPVMCPLQKLILAALLKNDFLSIDEIRDVASTFKQIDHDNDGLISIEDFRFEAKRLHLDGEDVDSSFHNLEMDSSHFLEIKEFFL